MRWHSAAFRARRQAFAPNRIVWLVGLGMALSLLGDATMYVVLPTQFSHAGILAAEVGIMLSANRAIRIFLNSPYGFIIERIPRRQMLIPALFLGAFSTLLYTVPGFWPLLIGRFLWGAAWAGLALGGTTVILDIATDADRGQMIGRYQMWFFIGVGVSSLLGGLLFDLVGYTSTFTIAALGTLTGAVIWLLFLPETRPDKPKIIASDVPPASESAPDPSAGTMPKMSKPPLILAITLYGLNRLILVGLAATLVPILLQDRIGDEVIISGVIALQIVTFTGALRAFNRFISLFSSPLSGWLSDKSGNRWQMVTLSLVLAVTALTMAALGSGVVAVLATMLTAIAQGVLVTQVFALVGDFARPGSGREMRQGRILGIMNTVGDIGGAIGPFLVLSILLQVMDLASVYTLGVLVLLLFLPGTLWMMWRAGLRGSASVL